MVRSSNPDSAMISSSRPTQNLNLRAANVCVSATERLSCFVLAVLGFSFWFLLAVPFATHRETYSWLAGVDSQPIGSSLGIISVTYRPFAQLTTWLAFCLLKNNFPTSITRQAFLQGCVYSLFLGAWWFICGAARQRRLFAMIAFITGGVFFSGYVHLFHVYGLMYVAVIVTLGLLLYRDSHGINDRQENWMAGVAVLLVFWHPFATALFLGYFFGRYIDTFDKRSRTQHMRALIILALEAVSIYAMVALFGRADVHVPLPTRLAGAMESYRTNEVNVYASLAGWALSVLVVMGMRAARPAKVVSILLLFAFGVIFLRLGIPEILLWVAAALVKLCIMRRWSLFFLTLTAAALPFGGIIGAPVFALFVLILAAYVTALDWESGEDALSFMRPAQIGMAALVALVVMVAMRNGADVPPLSNAAHPLLVERERTYQLEHSLAWLHTSKYCSDDIAYAQDAGSPVDSGDNIITRHNRPPSDIEDARLFWKTELQCRSRDSTRGVATITFGDARLTNETPVLRIPGHYAGDAIVWVKDTTEMSANGTNTDLGDLQSLSH
jgi:hypothetical protein